MRRKQILITCLALVCQLPIAGCYGPAVKYSDMPKDATIIEKMNLFMNTFHQGLFSPDNIKFLGRVLDNPGVTTKDGMPAFKKWWCIPKEYELRIRQTAEKLLVNHCEHLNGQFKEGWCRDAHDEPLFMGKISNPISGCSGFPAIRADVVSGEGQDVAQWQNTAVTQLSYRPWKNIKQSREAERREHIRGERMEASRREENAIIIMNKGVGTQICRIYKNPLDGDVIAVGYVEQVANSRIKVLISDMHFRGAPNMHPGGFQEKTIWDDPANWYPCHAVGT